MRESCHLLTIVGHNTILLSSYRRDPFRSALQLTEAPPSADRCQSAQKTHPADLEIENRFPESQDARILGIFLIQGEVR
jgi:hypothetical protein